MKYAGLFALALAAVAVGMPEYTPPAAPYTPPAAPYTPPAPEPYKPAYTPPAYTPPPAAYTPPPPAYTPEPPPAPCDPEKKACPIPGDPNYKPHKHSKFKAKINLATALATHVDHAAEKVVEGAHKLKEIAGNVIVDIENKFTKVGHEIATKIAKHKCNKKEYKETCTNHCKDECPKKCDQHCHSDHIEIAITKCTETCKKEVKKQCVFYVKEEPSSSSSSSSSSSTDCKGPSCPPPKKY